MVAVCFAPIRVPSIRVTALDACGAVSTSACSSVSSTGIITIEQTGEYNERQDFFTLNADGQPCITDTSPPILKWINVVITFCKVDPEMWTILTGEPPDPTRIPQGCRFHPRCPVVVSGRAAELGIESRCRGEDVALRTIAPEHDAACYEAFLRHEGSAATT